MLGWTDFEYCKSDVTGQRCVNGIGGVSGHRDREGSSEEAIMRSRAGAGRIKGARWAAQCQEVNLLKHYLSSRAWA